jgi:pimeloyl-ACP methyl ester carboxylesterase
VRRRHLGPPSTPLRGAPVSAREERLDGGGVEIAASLVQGSDQSTPLVGCIRAGGYTWRYFDVAGNSFLSRARENGFAALAHDPPGYADRAPRTVEHGWFPAQARILEAAISDARRRHRGAGLGMVVLGHSFGVMVAMRIAARDLDRPLLGLAITGTSDAVVTPIATVRRRARRVAGPCADRARTTQGAILRLRPGRHARSIGGERGQGFAGPESGGRDARVGPMATRGRQHRPDSRCPRRQRRVTASAARPAVTDPAPVNGP